MTQPTRLCAICLAPVQEGVETVMDGGIVLMHPKCQDALREEMANSKREERV